MTATLDDVAAILRDLLTEARAMRLTYEAHQEGPVAPSSMSDDPKIHRDLPDWEWKGPANKGKSYSECESEYLDLYAASLTRLAQLEKAEGKQYKGKPAYLYTLANAGRARRWALRKRTGWIATPKPKEPEGFAASSGFDKPEASAFGGGGFANAPSADADAFDFGHNVKETPAALDDDDDL